MSFPTPASQTVPLPLPLPLPSPPPSPVRSPLPFPLPYSYPYPLPSPYGYIFTYVLLDSGTHVRAYPYALIFWNEWNEGTRRGDVGQAWRGARGGVGAVHPFHGGHRQSIAGEMLLQLCCAVLRGEDSMCTVVAFLCWRRRPLLCQEKEINISRSRSPYPSALLSGRAGVLRYTALLL